jgi:perosamine synthetase
VSTPTASALAIAGGEPALPPSIHRHWPEITADDRAAVNAVLDGNIWGIHAQQVTALQDEWAEYCGTKHALAVTTGTAALRCAVVASGVQPGDEVILPAFGYMASAQAVALAGGVPVFCDNDPDTFNLDVHQASTLITSRTKALMPVYLHGLMTDTDAVTALADTHNLAIVADAAQAAGATDHGRRAGTVATCTAFSLNGQKPFQAGEGGLVTTNDSGVFEAVAKFASLGEHRPRRLKPGESRVSWAQWLGDQYRMHEMTAALARSQLKRLDDYLATARRNAAILSGALAELPGFAPPHIPDGCHSSHYRFRVRLDPQAYGWEGNATEFRDRVLYALQNEGVAADTWQLYPIPAQPAFRRSGYLAWSPGLAETPLRPWNPGDYPVASRLLDTSITLGADPYPLHVQREDVIRRYLMAFEKVARNMSVVLTANYKPVRPAPSIPDSEL